MQDKRFSLHWSQWLCPGPQRKFSAEEMARGGQQPWPKVIDGYVLSNVVLLLAISYQEMPRHLALLVSVACLLAAYAALRVSRWLWRAPTRLHLNLASTAMGMLCVGSLLLFKFWPPLQLERKALVLLGVMGLAFVVLTATAWWFLTILRVQQIDARLRELDEQARNLKLARRLATAQIQPHFLFNTLASVQHWVDTQDPRAGSTLRSFTAYLRATLPMFERETLSLAEELQIVRSYLEVMQARMGSRLCWHVDADPALNDLPLPPGLLLTLVENAIGHGIEPSLRGGSITVTAKLNGGWACLGVQDNGAGLAAEGEPSGGVGLSNSRARLAQVHGPDARLSLLAQSLGCLARVEIPWGQNKT